MFVFLPMAFMIVMTVWALCLLIGQYKLSLIGIISVVLLMLALILIIESARVLKGKAAVSTVPPV